MKKITLNDPESKSADILADNIQNLKVLFPEAWVEDKIDFDVLKQLLGGSVEDREEKYGLNWHGKRQARQLALTPSTGTLRPCPEESVEWDTTQNLMIEGDNLEVLKLLQKSYAGKVKLIYIDPPYNTGKDFVYPDNYQDNIRNYLELTGQVEGGQKITTNPEASGRFHTDWLNMMYPRLKAARSVLRRDGVIFISIDDKELPHLRLLANEIFGEENFIASISVVNNLKGRNDKKHVAPCHEYVVMYSNTGFISYGLPLNEDQRKEFKYSDEKGNKYALRDLRKRGGPDKRTDRPNMYFPIYWNQITGKCSLVRINDNDQEILPIRGDGSDGRWRWGFDKIEKHIEWIHAKKSERSGRFDVEHRLYLDPSISVDSAFEDDDEEDEGNLERTSKPKSVWIGGEFSTDNGKRSLKKLLPGESFDFPKSIEFLKKCITIGTSKNDIVLDLFAGSGATGQAAMELNALDGHSRRYILVQLPEQLDPEDKNQKAAAEVCDRLNLKRDIAELTKERLRRAGQKIRAELEAAQEQNQKNKQQPLFADFASSRAPSSLDLGFRVFKLDTSNIRPWSPDRDNLELSLVDYVEHIKDDRSEADVLYELLLKLGLDLCVPMEQRVFAGKTVHSIGGGVLLVCLDKNISSEILEELAQGIVEWHKALAPVAMTTCVFRDNGFADDVVKTNLAAILHQHGLVNVRSL